MELYQTTFVNSTFLPVPAGEVFSRQAETVPVGSGALLGKEHEITSPPLVDPDIYRVLEKYELQRISANLLEPFKVKGRTGKVQAPRVCKCLQVPRTPQVEVWKSIEHEKFFYGGLVICGSVWDCLPCTTKISERRKIEIDQAIKIWEARGGSVFMLTLTFPHYSHQSISGLLEKFSAARRLMRKRNQWQNFCKFIQYAGHIYRLETTFGDNGAHIHSHEIIFSELPHINIPSFIIHPFWQSACIDSGLDEPSVEHGVKISTPKEMADYVSKVGKERSKWTLGLEMTKGHIKRGKFEGLTPFDLLRAFRDTGDCYYSEKFIEYSKAFKGKKQLNWSRGLRDRLCLGELKTDEDIVNEKDAFSVLFSLIDHETWSLIRKYNLRGQLIVTCNYGIEAVQDFIILIKQGRF